MMRYIFRGKMLRDGATETLERYEKSTRPYEIVHLVLVIPYGFVFGVWLGMTYGIAITMLWNVFPVMLQRYNRARIYRILRKRKSRLEAMQVESPIE